MTRLPTIRELDRLSVANRYGVLEAHARELRRVLWHASRRPIEAEAIRCKLRSLYRLGDAFGVELRD